MAIKAYTKHVLVMADLFGTYANFKVGILTLIEKKVIQNEVRYGLLNLILD